MSNRVLSDENKTVLSQHYRNSHANNGSALMCISWLATWEDLNLLISLRSLVCLMMGARTDVSHNSLPQGICIV